MLMCKHSPRTPQQVWLRHFNKKNFISFFYVKIFPISCRGWFVFVAEFVTFLSMSLIVGDKPWRVSLFYTPVSVIYARVTLICTRFSIFHSLYIYLSYLIEKKENKGVDEGEIQGFTIRGLRILPCTNLRGLCVGFTLMRVSTRAHLSYKKQIVMYKIRLIRQYAGKSAPTFFFRSISWI